MKAYVINRKGDGDRLKSVLETAANDPSLDIVVIEAIDGGLPNFEVPKDIASMSFIRNMPKTVACFMSHVKCWESIADSSDDFGLVLEDDSLIVPKFSDVEKEVAELEFDLCFVNVRARNYLQLSGLSSEIPYRTVNEVVMELLTKGHDVFEDKNHGGQLPPPGGDGYIISRAGAEKLLNFAARDRYPHHVDHWMFFRSMSDEIAWKAASKESIGQLLKATARNSDQLNGLIRSNALVWTNGKMPSVRL